METLARLQDAVIEALDPEPLLRRLAEQALALVDGADGAAIELLTADRRELTYVATAGLLAPHVGTRVRVDASLSGLAVRSRAVQRVEDVDVDDRVDAEACRRVGVARMVCVPLLYGDHPVGVLKVSWARPDSLVAADLSVLGSLAEFISFVAAVSSRLGTVVNRLWQQPGQPTTAESELARCRQVASFVAEVLAPGVTDGVAARERVERLLAGAGPVMVFQPIVDLATRLVVGYEALARFEDRRSPDVWFAEAHAAGLGADLELRAIGNALAAFGSVDPAVYLSVNVSPATLADPRLLGHLGPHLGQRPVVVELTEHAAIADYQAVNTAVARLRSLGMRFAIDDVGSGYASLRHVVDLRPDILKLDRSLVSYLDEDPPRHAVAAAFAQVATKMGWTVIAEGLERGEELDACQAIGVGHGQGYLLGKPEGIVRRGDPARSRG